jgi:ankyrin repeat protein
MYVSHDNINILDCCREAGVEAKDIDDYTPLLTAAEFGRTEAYKLLLSKGDRVKMIAAQNKDKKSALFLATESNHPELVKVSW